MYKLILLFLFLALAFSAQGQTSKTSYFTSQWLTKEVTKSKARFSQTITHNTDSTTTIEIKDLTKDLIIRSETYKGKEPYGIWKNSSVRGASHLNYNFPLIYSVGKCDSIPIITANYFQDNDSIGYKAPKIKSGEFSISQFVNKKIIYPARAMDENIQGIVDVLFTLTQEGSVENVIVTRGVHSIIDKEAVRVLKQLKFVSPPTLNDKPLGLPCIVVPIKFVIGD